MAMKNLYPPIMPTTIPTFVRGGRVRVHFQLSSYMTIDAIYPNIIQVSVTKQNNNKSIINKARNGNSEIYVTSLGQDSEGYYFELDPYRIDFASGEYYKVQARFLSAKSPASEKDFKTKLTSYLDYMSEWSSVCLIRAISKPTLTLNGLDSNINTQRIFLQTSSLTVRGALVFEDEDEIETLQSYKIWLYEGNSLTVSSSDTLICESDIIYAETYNLNELNYLIKYNLKNQVHYFLKIQYTTSGGYVGEKTYILSPSLTTLAQIKTLEATVQQDFLNGYNKIHIYTSENETFQGKLVLKRASNEDGFQFWDDLQYFYYDLASEVDILYKDHLIKHGVAYAYQLVQEDSQKNRSVPLNLPTGQEEDKIIPFFCQLEDMSLIGSDTEKLNIKFDPNISNFQYTVAESKTETLGGKYPFIRRNGDTYYRQFSITGLISHYCEDEEPLEYTFENIGLVDSLGNSQERCGASHLNESFIDTLNEKREKFLFLNDSTAEVYQRYYQNNLVEGHEDFLLEREYREAVMDFLYKNAVRLFRSPTEGNILIKLMNISLSPNQTLGRLVYTFTATAFEIDEYSLENCIKYGIHTLNTIEESSEEQAYSLDKIGQLRINESDTSGTIKVLNKIAAHWDMSTEKYNMSINYLKWVRLQFLSPPYKIYQYFDTLTGKKELLFDEPAEITGNMTNFISVVGYAINVDGVHIVIPAHGYYELAGDETKINDLQIFYPYSATTNIIANIDFEANIFAITKEHTLQSSFLYYLVGQLNKFTGREKIAVGKNVVDIIAERHQKTTDELTTTDKLSAEVIGLSYLSIEAQPYTKVYIKDSSDLKPELHIINRTGILTLACENTYIEEIYFDSLDTDDDTTNKIYYHRPESDEEIIYNKSWHLKDIIIDYVALIKGGLYG